MKSTLIILINIFLPLFIIAQVNYNTDPNYIKRFKKWGKKADKRAPVYDGAYLWEWESNIEIDSLELISSESPIYPKNYTKHSPTKADALAFEYMRIDSIDSNLILCKDWAPFEIGKFIKDKKLHEGAGKIYGYIVLESPMLIFGNSAHNFFKIAKTTTISSPYAERVIYDYMERDHEMTRSFFIIKKDTVQEIKTNNDIFPGLNEEEYYMYIRRNLPLDRNLKVHPWQANIEIDSLEFIDPQSSILPKNKKEYTSLNGDPMMFNYIRIDTIDSRIVIYKGWYPENLERFLTNKNILKNCGKIYGYIIDESPTLVFGNYADKFFKVAKTITISSPYTPRIIENYQRQKPSWAPSFSIYKDNSLSEWQSKTPDFNMIYERLYYNCVSRLISDSN